MGDLTITGSGILDGLLSLVVILLGVISRQQDTRIKDLEAFKDAAMTKWTSDAVNYVSKQDFNSLAQELKESLHRIEDKIEKLRDSER